MRKILFIAFLFLFQFAIAQQVEQRLIIFGDAGEINSKQSFLIKNANSLQIPNKTKAFFIGDNIYPTGMALSGKKKEETQEILKSQFEGFRELQVPVYFLAGNHDWDRSGKEGLEKIKAQADFLNNYGDPGLKYLPEAGKIGPTVLTLNPKTIAVLYDSEFWLFPHHNRDVTAEKDQFIADIKKILEKNRDKTVLMISHHPMVSFGDHSLIYNWKDHIFPLTDVKSSLYIPLPGIGSLYPLLRTHVVKFAEDLKHPIYQDLIKRVTDATAEHPKVLFVAGHDHGLQYIEQDKIRQVVSGSGSKQSDIHQREPLKYGYNKQGFSVIDLLNNGKVRLTFYIDSPKDSLTKSYEVLIEF
ncbi:metallophosphoesterase [Sphingobacterium sp.]|uniref:metallophosphoesterase n=1 Tax=Sphingobacterium sp. TaxID=341027 RepID=UPI0028ADD639|nr:metallophosphoesterase [Sphingobacterium sp.]